MLDYQISSELKQQPKRPLDDGERKEPTIALLHCYDLIDDFLDSIDLSFETFCQVFVGSWMFGYINALKQAGVRTVLFCISARVTEISRYRHEPTGATLCVLPASQSYRRYRSLRNHLLRSYGGNEGQAFKNISDANVVRRSALTNIKDLIKSVGTYLSTPLNLLAQELKQEGCQAILCQEYEFARFDACVWLGKRINLPVFATFQGGTQTQSWLEYPFRHLAFRSCRGVVVATQTEIERIRQRYSLPDVKIARIFNPIELTSWQQGDRTVARELLGIPLNARVAVWHGRVEIERKGLDLLLDAWYQVCRDRPNQALRLLLVGTGSDAAKLHQRLASQPLPGVIWIDEFINDAARIQQYLAAADVYVMSSRQEGFPVAPLEAMSCGLPIVATDAPGIPDILEQGEQSGGLRVPCDNAPALAGAMGRVLDDLDWAKRLGQQARSRVETQFSSQSVGQLLRDFLLPDAGLAKDSSNPAEVRPLASFENFR
jgi:glycosyltransferase involved in cell wall biosynthesis